MKKTTQKREIGRLGELLATSMLEEKGYRIIKRNYVCPYGEIDIIAEKKQEICFVEVKTRCSGRYGYGRDAVNKRKQEHIRRCSQFYLQENCISFQTVDFQVIEITASHIRGLVF